MKKDSIMRTAWQALSILYKEDRRGLLKNFAIGIFQTFCIVGTTVFMQRFFDALAVSANGGTVVSSAIIALGCLAVVTILSEVLNGYQNHVYGVYIENGKIVLSKLMHRKCRQLTSEDFNNPDFLTQIEKARGGIENLTELVLVLGDILTFYGLYFVLMGGYLFSLNKMLPLVVLLVFIPVLISHGIKMGAYVALEQETAGLRRIMDHYQACMANRTFLKETRLLNAEKYFFDKYQKTLNCQIGKQVAIELKSTRNEFFARVCTFIGYGGIIVLLSIELINNRISVGAFGAIFASTKLMFSLMDEVISYHIGDLSQNIGTVQNYLHLINDKKDADLHPGEALGFSTLSLKNVSYRYPKQSNNALTNINLDIKAGEVVALVGENGAGKSTLARIIMGYYAPTEGQVVRQNSNIKPRITTTAAFQSFNKYAMTIDENVHISDCESAASPARLIKDFAPDMAALSSDTLLGVDFGGRDLSHGQWQGVALARAFYRNASMMMLDEPTSAIDPLKEDHLFTLFRESLGNKTGVIVTHRLASICYADKVIVLKHGQIIEAGTHDELMEKQAEYYTMYCNQASSYADHN